MWIGYDGLGTTAASPGPTSTHIRCEKPSLAPIVVHACVSGSSSTPNLSVQVGDREAQLRDAPAGRVAVVARVRTASASFSTATGGRRQVGVAEPEVDHVLTGPPGLHLQRVDHREDVRRKRWIRRNSICLTVFVTPPGLA